MEFSSFAVLIKESVSSTTDGSCGPDLEYHPSFLELIASARSRPEQQLGDSIIAAREPDWCTVLEQGLALAQRSRDLRIAAVVTQAATEIHGLSGFADGLALIRTWLERHWDDLHPALNFDGEHDPLIRMNALAALADPEGALKSVRKAQLLESRAGTLSVGDAEAILKGKPPSEAAVVTSAAQLERLLAEEQVRNASRQAALTEAASALGAIESLWREKVHADFWPEFGALRELLTRLCEFIARHARGVPESSTVALTLETHTLSTSRLTPATHDLPDELSNRRDAFRALAISRRYFERHEPSHPAPLLIRRIERLEGLGFMDILAELSPDAFAQIRHITGTTDAVG